MIPVFVVKNRLFTYFVKGTQPSTHIIMAAKKYSVDFSHFQKICLGPLKGFH